MKAILGKKIGMTQIFSEDGSVIPVTVIEAGPTVVTQIKTEETDGYNAVQVGFENAREKLLTKPQLGHLKKAGVGAKKHLREFSVSNVENYELAQEFNVDTFEVGEMVDVTGTSKGKGTQGPIKRHGQSRGPEAHGSRYHRRPGSMGGASDPSRVFKGKNLAGRMGGERVTVKNLKIVQLDAEKNLILIKGAIPGPKKGLVIIKESAMSAELKEAK